MIPHKDSNWFKVFVELSTESGTRSVLEKHEIKDGCELIFTLRRINGVTYAKCRKRKLENFERG